MIAYYTSWVEKFCAKESDIAEDGDERLSERPIVWKRDLILAKTRVSRWLQDNRLAIGLLFMEGRSVYPNMRIGDGHWIAKNTNGWNFL
ncbi:MAG: hypothetical protein ACLSHL_09600 [Alistipes communis]